MTDKLREAALCKLLTEARETLWQPANPDLCGRIDEALAQQDAHMQPAGDADMTVYRGIAANYHKDKADLTQQDHELVQDAERWRRLVAEHSHPQPLCAVVWKKDGVRNSSEWVNMSNDNDLTRFVDALPEAVPTPPAQEKQS